jgi:putative acetyltransferase
MAVGAGGFRTTATEGGRQYASTAPNVYNLRMHRLATSADASRLFELRRKSIVVLAPGGMSQAEAESWAAKLTVAGMQEKLSRLEIWVAEADACITGWAAIHGDRLEGIYVDPAFAGKGIGSGLLELVEARMRAKGLAAISAEASANAERFYLQRGYQPAGIRTREYGLPIRKRLG